MRVTVEADTMEEFAYALEYLVRLVGVDTPVHLHGIARALHIVNWDLPRPEPVTAERNVFGFHACLCETACDFLAAGDNAPPLNAHALLDYVPSKPAIRKMCFVHHKAKLTPGFRFVAARSENGTAAYVPNGVISEEEACDFLKKGWCCLFVKNTPARPRPSSVAGTRDEIRPGKIKSPRLGGDNSRSGEQEATGYSLRPSSRAVKSREMT